MTFALAATCAFAGVAGQKICIDPGHGGSDPGAVGNGLYEDNINLDIGLRMNNLFIADAASTRMTRSTDVYVSLQGRCDIANSWGANRFECTHCNSFSDPSANGTETFSYSSTGTAADLRNKVNPEIVSHMGTYNRGVKTYGFYVLVNTNMPAILGEVAFISNPTDAAKLGNATYRQEAARAYLHGTQSHYGEAPHDPGSVADIIIDNSSGSFSCSATWATGTGTGKYGADYRWRSTAATSDPATWTPNITVSGSWTVYAWWAAGTNRSANSAYQIHTTGGDTNVYVNQQVNGGMWNSLGAHNLGTGGYWVKKSCWASTGYVVIADAIKWHKN
jgi:N-acetylmuramoyl-L-alanine amidase